MTGGDLEDEVRSASFKPTSLITGIVGEALVSLLAFGGLSYTKL